MKKGKIVRIIVQYSEELEYIKVDNIEMDNIDSIKKLPIKDWFEPSNGRDGWEGLIDEIEKLSNVDMRNTNGVKISWEFQGPEKYKSEFENCISERELENYADSVSDEEIIQLNVKEAKRKEHLGLDSFSEYMDAAKKGNSEAQYKVAESYYKHYKGENNAIQATPEESILKAVDFYKKSAEHENINAQYRLFKILSKGDGVNIDLEMAVTWLKKVASSMKIPEAMYELGDCYDIGKGVKKDKQKAVEWYQKAAEQGDAEARYKLGYCYYCGEGVKKNLKQAAEWYQKATEQGCLRAQNELGNCYCFGEGVEKSYQKAAEWYRKAAEQGDAEAQCNLGYCYYCGEGVEKDVKQAVEWYQKAAKQGDEEAQNELGNCYCFGEGVEKSYQKAAEWYQKAAEQGHMYAQYNLGDCYYYDSGVKTFVK